MKVGKLILFLFLVASALLLFCSNAAQAQENAEPEVEKMDEKDAYEVLGLGKRATEAEIRKAFKDKSLVRPHHPLSFPLSHLRLRSPSNSVLTITGLFLTDCVYFVCRFSIRTRTKVPRRLLLS